MTHSELCFIASKWLKNTLHCRCVLTEPKAYTLYGEQPDAIGWVGGRCILVECKTSYSDFKADLKKPFRDKFLSSNVLGNWRFYLTIPGIIPLEEIPQGWGLYELNGKRIIHKSGAKYSNAAPLPWSSNKTDEIAILLYYIDALKNEDMK